MPDDVTVTGWVLRETPSGMAWVFLWDERERAMDTVVLPKSQVAVVKGTVMDKVTMPYWLAEEKGLI
jgi:hypothetical protein